jgi:hypothetical protein
MKLHWAIDSWTYPTWSLEVPKVYLHCLYFKTLPTVFAEKKAGRENSELLLRGHCYVVGDKTMDSCFKNIVLRAFVDSVYNQPHKPSIFPDLSVAKIIYEGTTEKGPARRLLVDIWAGHAHEDWIHHLNDSLPHWLVLDISRAVLTKKKEGKNVLRARAWKERIKVYDEKKKGGVAYPGVVEDFR